jgi:hypothetical protein
VSVIVRLGGRSKVDALGYNLEGFCSTRASIIV